MRKCPAQLKMILNTTEARRKISLRYSGALAKSRTSSSMIHPCRVSTTIRATSIIFISVSLQASKAVLLIDASLQVSTTDAGHDNHLHISVTQATRAMCIEGVIDGSCHGR